MTTLPLPKLATTLTRAFLSADGSPSRKNCDAFADASEHMLSVVTRVAAAEPACDASSVDSVTALTFALGGVNAPLRLASDVTARRAVFALLEWAGCAARELLPLALAHAERALLTEEKGVAPLVAPVDNYGGQVVYDCGTRGLPLPSYFSSRAVECGFRAYFCARERAECGEVLIPKPKSALLRWLSGEAKGGGSSAVGGAAAADPVPSLSPSEAERDADDARTPPAPPTLLAPPARAIAAIHRVQSLLAILLNAVESAPAYAPAQAGVPSGGRASAREPVRVLLNLEAAAAAGVSRPFFMANEVSAETWSSLWRAARAVAELGLALDVARAPWCPLLAERCPIRASTRRGADVHSAAGAAGLHAFVFSAIARRAELAATAWREASITAKMNVSEGIVRAHAEEGLLDETIAGPGGGALTAPKERFADGPNGGIIQNYSPNGGGPITLAAAASAAARNHEDDRSLEARSLPYASVALSASFLWLTLARTDARSTLPVALWPPAIIAPSLVSPALQLAAFAKDRALYSGKAGPMSALLPAALACSRLWESAAILSAPPVRGGLRAGVEVPVKLEPSLTSMAATPLRLAVQSVNAVLLDFPADGLSTFATLAPHSPTPVPVPGEGIGLITRDAARAVRAAHAVTKVWSVLPAGLTLAAVHAAWATSVVIVSNGGGMAGKKSRAATMVNSLRAHGVGPAVAPRPHASSPQAAALDELTHATAAEALLEPISTLLAAIHSQNDVAAAADAGAAAAEDHASFLATSRPQNGPPGSGGGGVGGGGSGSGGGGPTPPPYRPPSQRNTPRHQTNNSTNTLLSPLPPPPTTLPIPARETCATCGRAERSAAPGGSPSKAPLALLVCTRCRDARYCSIECQKKHWALHKLSCKAVANVITTD